MQRNRLQPVVTIARGFTLVELLVALAILSVLSVAVTTILAGAANANLHVVKTSDAVSEAENAFRRILHNLRTAAALSEPAAVTTTSRLTLVTQPDSANGNQSYTVTYALSGTDLTESDTRYNTAGVANVIARNVTAFQVKRNSLSSPQSVTVTITIGTQPPVKRSLTVFCRNL